MKIKIVYNFKRKNYMWIGFSGNSIMYLFEMDKTIDTKYINGKYI